MGSELANTVSLGAARSDLNMKVLDLCCTLGHTFEGWFGSEEDFLSQQARQLVQCPVCGDATVVRRPSAPRLNLSAARGDALPASASPQSVDAAPVVPGSPPTNRGDVLPKEREAAAAVQAAFVQAVREVLQNTEDVGERFTEEARRMHYGESQTRGIRGQATPEQRAELHDEGIEVFALPIPQALKGPAH